MNGVQQMGVSTGTMEMQGTQVSAAAAPSPNWVRRGKYSVVAPRMARAVALTLALGTMLGFADRAEAQADTTAPTGEFIRGGQGHDGTSFDIVVLFSEPVSVLEASDFRLLKQGGTSTQPSVTNIQQDPQNERRYTITVSPNDIVGFLITLHANAVADASGNMNQSFDIAINYRPGVPTYAPLVANAGADRSVVSEGEVTLDGSGSTQTDSPRTVTYAWAQTSGTGGTLTNADKATARFTAPALNPGDADATHTFTLTVTDNQGSTQVTDTVTVTVTSPNAPPVADAGPDLMVPSGQSFTLDGSASMDPDGTIARYTWFRLNPLTGNNALITSSSSQFGANPHGESLVSRRC